MTDNITLNRTELPITRANAYTNNTFSLTETEISITTTRNNSFNYLKDLQNAYMRIYRFNLDESNLYINHNRCLSISVDKDLIDTPLRKEYRKSSFYNKYLHIDTIINNPDLFTFIPIVLIDGKMIHSFIAKAALDGHTDISFPHILNKKTFLSNSHTIEVFFIKNTIMKKFVVSCKDIINNNGLISKIPSEINLTKDDIVFVSFKESNRTNTIVEGTNIFPVLISENGNLVIDIDNEYIYNIISQYDNIEIAMLVPIDIYECEGMKQIRTRNDKDLKSSIVVIEPSLNGYYSMPIPPDNLFIFKMNKKTGEYTYENNRDIILHYPKIYEILSDDIDEQEYQYKVFYFYHETEKNLKYKDKFKYIYKYISEKLESSLEEAINILLYTKYKDEKLQKYFLDQIFDYNDDVYLYDHGDFFKKQFPYNMDYKIEKMKEFIEKDPYTLEKYAKELCVPSSTYYLFVKDIDLDARIRTDTNSEANNMVDRINLDEECYVFAFNNDDGRFLDLRFFIDGILYPNPIYIQNGLTDYIYIPKRLIDKDKSYIEIERFYTYTMSREIYIESPDDCVTIEFDFDRNIAPTLHDLYITTTPDPITGRVKKIDRSLFQIYALIDPEEYDIGDYVNKSNDQRSFILGSPYEFNEETNEIYIMMDNDYNESDESMLLSDPEYYCSRFPLKHMILKKIKIFSKNKNIIGKKFLLNIDKNPQMINTVIKDTRSPEILVNGFENTLNDKTSYIRTFINGMMIPLRYNVTKKEGNTYITPRCKTTLGDIVTFDITPFSYKLIYETKRVPEDFVIDLSNYLDKPFNTKYYDIYLNGRKLYDENIHAITPTLIKLFNVHSRNNLYIYQKDRDYEYYGFKSKIPIPLDTFFDLDFVSDDEKKQVMDNIIYDIHGDVEAGTDDEINWNDKYDFTGETLDEYDFYFDIIIPQFVAKPNSLNLNHSFIKEAYPNLYKRYSNNKDRVVLQPNKDYDASRLLILGKKCNAVIVKNKKG